MDLREKRKDEIEENYIIRSVIICTVHQILFG